MADSRHQTIMATVDDLALDFVAYDRKEDEELPRGAIEEALAASEVTIAQIVRRFEGALRTHLNTAPGQP